LIVEATANEVAQEGESENDDWAIDVQNGAEADDRAV